MIVYLSRMSSELRELSLKSLSTQLIHYLLPPAAFEITNIISPTTNTAMNMPTPIPVLKIAPITWQLLSMVIKNSTSKSGVFFIIVIVYESWFCRICEIKLTI